MNGGKPPGQTTILVVEDEEPSRRYVVTVLRAEGYVVLEAPDGPSAEQAATKYGVPVDLLLTDFVLPGSDGADLARRLRPRFPDLRVLFMSGHIDDAAVQEAVKEEAFKKGASFLQKPFAADDLVRRVRAVLRGI